MIYLSEEDTESSESPEELYRRRMAQLLARLEAQQTADDQNRSNSPTDAAGDSCAPIDPRD
jgi:hypothetical protein